MESPTLSRSLLRSATPLWRRGDALALSERLGSFAHDLRGLTHTAMLAVAAIKTGHVGLAGATGAILDRSLDGLRRRIDRSLAETRVTAGLPSPKEVVSVTDFVAKVKESASLDALARECTFTVAEVESGLEVEVDREMLLSAVENLLQNAFKFTKPGTEVSLNARAAGDRVVIEVADHCGGLPPGGHEKLFLPFTQRSVNRAVSDSDCPSAGATSRQTTEFSESATSRAQGAFSPLTCLVIRIPSRL